MGMGLNLGLGLGSRQQLAIVDDSSVWECAVTTEKSFDISVTANTTITSTGGTKLRASAGGTDLTSLNLTANTITTVYFISPTSGTIVFPVKSNIKSIDIVNHAVLSFSITGMGLTSLFLYGTTNTVTGSITGMQLNSLKLSTAPTITGVLTGNLMTDLLLNNTTNNITWGSVTWADNLGTMRIQGSNQFSAAVYREIFINTAAVAWRAIKYFVISSGTSPGYNDGATPPQCKTAYDILIAKAVMTLTLPAEWKGGAYPNDFPA